MSPVADDVSVRAWARLIRAQQVLLERVEADLKAAGLPPLAWYDVLLELRRAARGQLRQYEIGERVLLSKYNVSRLLDRLEAEGLLTREPCAEDRRGANVAITREGRAAVRKMWPVYARGIEQYFASRFSRQELEQLAELMGRLIPRSTGSSG